MEIEVGEYVRCKYGITKFLGNITKENDYYNYYKIDRDFENINYIREDEIIKHSKNIIDLVEVGDYVNGYRVVAIMEDMETGEIHLEMTSDYTNEIIGDCTIYNDDIKSIVTKEQFSSIEYKVEED